MPTALPITGALRIVAVLSAWLQRIESSAQPFGTAPHRRFMGHWARLLDT